MNDFIFDFETRSRVDLGKCGVAKYATDSFTEATLLTWCFDRTGTIKAWRKGQPIPPELIHVAENPEKYRFVAQNILFDYMIWINVFIRSIPTLRKPPVENIDDLMAISCHFRTGASLEAIAQMIGLPYSKDKEGRVLMLKQCKPDSKGNFIELTIPEWDSFERYGKMDTQILREAYYRIPSLPPMERFAFEWTFKRNLKGIRLDKALLYQLDAIVETNKPKLAAEFEHLTGYKASVSSPIKCKAFFKDYYPWIEDMQANTVRDMLAYTGYVPKEVRRALEIKDLIGSTSISKIKTALTQVHNGRMYEILAYHYTQTKRWAGRGIQIQNFPRVDNSRQDKLDFNLDVEDLAGVIYEIRPRLKDPVGFAKNLLRRLWLPDEGQTFYCGDFSKVEPSVLFWLVGLGDIPKRWYEEMAAEIYGMPIDKISKDSDERQVGKTAALSCGYGAGWESFIKKTYKDTGILLTEEMGKRVIQAYRKKYSVITKFWRDLEDGFRAAIYGRMSVLCGGKMVIEPMPHPWRGVQIRLPSGSYLYYHQAKEVQEEYLEEINEIKNGVPVKYQVKKIRNVIKYLADQGQGRVAWDYVYSGLLCENVVSATSRDIMVPAMYRLEDEGISVLGCIHDELWGSDRPGRELDFEQLMCVNPSWCDMKIGAEIKSGRRYLK